jgi:murein tripeptide amidase MpaA
VGNEERIAVSREGNAVYLLKVTSSESFGSDAGKVRVMLFAQQHGDEPSGKEALPLRLTKAYSGKLNDLLERVDLLIVPQVNPDGSERC